ncbi:MAG: FMN-binding protein [Phycisphaerales bacterium]|nr:MAG: FMN-binding protein [Phycisphaerales bacterium]
MSKFLSESWLVLVMAVVFAGLLAGTQTALTPAIERNKRAALEAAVFDVVPGAVRFEEQSVGLYTVYKCFDDKDRFVGWGIPHADFGFQDKIRLVVGLSPDGATVTGLKVVENTETPGLGNKIEADEWRGQFAGLDAGSPVKVVKKPRTDERHEIQAITGATISSEAVTKIANRVLTDVRPKLLERE